MRHTYKAVFIKVFGSNTEHNDYWTNFESETDERECIVEALESNVYLPNLDLSSGTYLIGIYKGKYLTGGGNYGAFIRDGAIDNEPDFFYPLKIK